MEKILDRFLRYIAIDTQADPNSESQPSAARELNLSRLLCDELTAMGVQAELDEYGYEIVNIDMMIYLQKPNLKDYKSLIAQNLKKVLNTQSVNVKATTLEKQGLIGTCKGIGTETVILIKKQSE